MSDNWRRWALAATTLVSVTGCEAEGETIGPRGGVLVSDDGRFSLEIPPGALDQEIEITLQAVPCGRADALVECYEVGPVGLPLQFPAEVVYEVDEVMMETFGADELAVVVEKEDDWNLLADRKVDRDDATISASVVFLSSFALVTMR